MIHFWTDIEVETAAYYHHDWMAEGQQLADQLGEPVSAWLYDSHLSQDEGQQLHIFSPADVQLGLRLEQA